MAYPQPLPQPELPLCDSLIIWVSVAPCSTTRRRPPSGRAEHGASCCHVHLLRAFPSGTRALYTATAPRCAQVARRRWPPLFLVCCHFGPKGHPWF